MQYHIQTNNKSVGEQIEAFPRSNSWKYQSSFLPGMGTTDNAIILKEVVHSMRKSKKKKGDVVYKIDLEKYLTH
jgi:hypothetical protein